MAQLEGRLFERSPNTSKNLAERDRFGDGFRLCPDSTIVEVCAQATFVETIDDIHLFGTRSERVDITCCDCTVSTNVLGWFSCFFCYLLCM